MRKLLPLIMLVVAAHSTAWSQQLPLYTQYAFNPYLVNPSMVAASGRAEINLLYRQQWTQVTDAPKVIQFDAQMPLNNKMAIGFNVVNNKSVLLSATSMMLTYGYKVQLATDQTLGFGLSAGLFANRVNLSEIAPADQKDPALLNAKNNNMAVDGQFGVSYRFRAFTLGYSIVNLFDRKTFTPETFQSTKLGKLKNQIVFASYRFTVMPETWYFQPNVAYRLTQDNLNYYELSGIVSYRNMIEVGGGYRQNFGPTTMVRLNIGPIQAGFAYDFPVPNAQISTGGTREIQLKWRFGKDEPRPSTLSKKNSAPVLPVEEKPIPKQAESQPIVQKQEEKVEPKPIEETKPAVVEPTPIVVEQKKEPEPEVKKEPVVEKPVEQPQPSLKDFYLLIVGTFEDRANAETFNNSLQKRGVKSEIIESTSDKGPHYYYVHLPDQKSKEITLERIMEAQKATGFKDAWYKKID